MRKAADINLPNTPLKVGQLTFTRFIAAVLVVAFHHYKINNLFSNANVFVSYFYLLSGFVLMLSQKEKYTTGKEYQTFYINRFARIFPVYLLALLSFVALEGHLGWDFILHVLGIQSFVPQTVMKYNYPGWSISVELFFYFCFPFLASYFYSRYPFKKVAVIAVGFWAVCQLLFTSMYFSLERNPSETLHNFLYYNPINHLNEFILGSIAAFPLRKNHSQWKGNYDVPLLALTAFAVVYLFFIKPSVNIFDHNGLLAVMFVPMIVLLSLNTGWITKLFNTRLLVLLGEISFGVYILAEPVLGAINHTLARLEIQHFPFSIMLLTLILVCYLVYVYFEKPLQQIIKKRMTGRKAGPREEEKGNVPPLSLQPVLSGQVTQLEPGEPPIGLSQCVSNQFPE